MHNEHKYEHDQKQDKTSERPDTGLGHVVYNVDDEVTDESTGEKKTTRREVEIADRESFPASDPPGYSGGTATNTE